MRRWPVAGVVGMAGLALARAAIAAPTEKIDFGRDILPVLSDNCFFCHGPDPKARKAKLRLDTELGAKEARKNGPAIVAGDVTGSRLMARITAEDEDERMPPADSNRKLGPQQIDLIRQWIRTGARWGRHWAFEKPRRPPLPEVVPPATAIRNPIDNFIVARLAKDDLRQAPEAPKETLIRRVTLDLTGLPPTPAEVDAFVADPSPDAYEKVVDRLLLSRRYGERWAWDWLDAARYADSNGFQADPDRTMWPWRDWVIDSLNDNVPYDQFTVEQLAGDLLPEATQNQVLATAFVRNNMFNGEGGRIPEETRVENVFDRLETTTTIWLGVSFGCARCHDHKFDPFKQSEYYQLFDFFNQSSEKGSASGSARSGQINPIIDLTTAEEKAQAAALAERQKKLAAEVDAMEEKIFPHPKGKTAAYAAAKQGLSGTLLGALAYPAGKRGVENLLELANTFESTKPAYAQKIIGLKRARQESDRFGVHMPRVMVMDQIDEPRETFVLVKGGYDKHADKVIAAIPASLSTMSPSAPSRRLDRLDLARWLVSPENPLTARVTVNRFWQAFFGIGIVKTVEDFGVQGEKPMHPELLDWLATELVSNGWDIKALHKIIVTSATYRQASKNRPLAPEVIARTGSQTVFELDPDNRLLARGPRFRLPSWMIRDQALASSGLLVEKVGGAPVMPYQPEGIWEEATFNLKSYKVDEDDGLYRRSLYIFWRRIVGPTMLFDNAARQTCTIKAFRTNTPLHALTTLNDIAYVEAARALAARVMLAEATDEGRVALAFRLATARRPSPEERAVLLSRLAVLKRQYAGDRRAAAGVLGVGASPRSRKLPPALHAAYTGLCSLILNLDETVTKE